MIETDRMINQPGNTGRLLRGGGPLDGTVDRKAVDEATAEECFAALCKPPALGDRTFTVERERYELRERFVGFHQHFICCNGEEVPLQEIPLADLQAWCIHAGRTPRHHHRAGFSFNDIRPAIVHAPT